MGEGAGLTSSGPLPPSIFIVGDRKQSIYAFRDADVPILEDARRYIEALRPGGDARRAISRSFRSVPAPAGVRQRRVAVTCRRPRDAATRFVTAKTIAFRSTGP